MKSCRNVDYAFSATFAESNWSEIQKIAQSGNADSYFSVGDEKSVIANLCQFNNTIDNTHTTQSVTTNFRIVGLNHDGENTITVCSKACLFHNTVNQYTVWTTKDSRYIGVADRLNAIVEEMFTSDIYSVMKTIEKTAYSDGETRSATVRMFIPSISEVGLYSYSGDGTQYPFFVNSQSRLFDSYTGQNITHNDVGTRTDYGPSASGAPLAIASINQTNGTQSTILVTENLSLVSYRSPILFVVG